MDELNDWFQLDEEFRKYFQIRMNTHFKELNEMVMNHGGHNISIQHNPIFLSGSTAEVGALCRCLAGDDVDLEYDAMLTHGEISNSTIGAQLLIPVEGHDGYFYLRGDPSGEILYPYHREKFISSCPKGHYWKVLFDELTKSPDDIIDTAVVKGSLLDIYRDIVTGPSCAASDDLIRYVHNFIFELPLSFAVIGMEAGMWLADNVFCFRLNYLPDCMADWLTHNESNIWPSRETCELMLSKGFHIVAKDGPQLSKTWRISTSACETILFDSLSIVQRKVYLAIKSLFYGLFKEEHCTWIIDGEIKSFPSYFLKTLFFQWRYRKEESFWEAGSDCIVPAVKEFFMMLHDSIVNKHSENFFIPSMPVISFEVIPKSTLTILASKCIQVVDNPLHYLKQTLTGFRAEVAVPIIALSCTVVSELYKLFRSIESILRRYFKEKYTNLVQLSTSHRKSMILFYKVFLAYDRSMDIFYREHLEKLFMTSVRKAFFKKIYENITENASCQLTKLESYFLELSWRLPPDIKDLFRYDKYGNKIDINAEYKEDMKNLQLMILSEISLIQTTLYGIQKVLHLL